MTPVSTGERVDVVDVLRGFALFGVLAFNMWFFSGARFDLTAWTEVLDRGIFLLTRLLIEAKFYSLFSLLFGWGMWVQMSRAEARGVKATRLLVRRLLVLLLLGTVHALLIWEGDILMLYAQMGLLLLLFRRRSDRTLLLATGLALLLSIVMRIPGAAMDAFREGLANLTAFMRQQTIGPDVLATGSYWQIMRYRAELVLVDQADLLYYMGNIFAMFLLGMYLARRRILHDIDQHRSLILVMTFAGLILGLIFNSAFVLVLVGQSWVPPEYFALLRVGFRTIGAPCLTMFYAGTIVLLFQNPAWRKRLAPLAKLGRMAFSNYIMQSVIATLIFCGYGLGLYGRTDPTFGLILTVLIYLGQLRFSAWWLERYQYGPLEWLWRTLTYGRRPPFRVGETSEDVRPLRWVERLRALWRRLNPRHVLALAWGGMAIWAALLVLWSMRLPGGIPTITFSDSGRDQEIEGTPGQQVPDAGDQVRRPEVDLPTVDPSAYRPGPIAESGNLLDLAESFDAGEAFMRIEELVGPSYLGRLAGSEQGHAAAEYIAARFAEYGLQPAGDDGTFFQEFPVPYSVLSSMPSLTSYSVGGEQIGEYEIYRDFTPLVRDYTGPGQGSGHTAWADECEHEDFDDLDVVGDVVICRLVSITDQSRQALEHGASALLLMIDPTERALDFAIPLRDAWLEHPLPTFWVSPEVVGDLLQDSGRSLDTLPMDSRPGELETTVSYSIDVARGEACPGEACVGRNVLGVLPGRDPRYADQIVIIGGHFDHMGQGPDGTVWPGANDDASGVAVVLEIARAWHEQGYVPRRTVLFAAWDAEEQGLLGSRHYVANPSFPLENTLAMLQLDMVAIGGERLFIAGEGLNDKILAAAGAYGQGVEWSDSLGSDHAPFLEARVPAAMLSWATDERIGETYHRPGDTPAAIEMEYLEWAGKISELLVLSIVDAEPALLDLIAARQDALVSGNLEAFLATASDDLRTGETLWFEDYQSLSASGIELSIDRITLSGASATGELRFRLTFESQGEQTQPAVGLTASMLARFEHDGEWRFAGPYLAGGEAEPGQAQPLSTFMVRYPAGAEFDAPAFAQQVGASYAEIAAMLGLPEAPTVDLVLLPNAQTLRASTGLSLSDSGLIWVGPGSVKLVFSNSISQSETLRAALIRLLLAEAGVNEAAAPWLWRGLPSALATGNERTELNSSFQPRLQRALLEGENLQDDVAAWAAVEYLRRELGWEGLGDLIEDIGRTCAYQCAATEGADAALLRAIGVDTQGFEADWRMDWSTRLENAQQALDEVLSARQAAILAGDLNAFLATIDPGSPALFVEESIWFEGLDNLQIDQLVISGEPLALLDGGQVLAEVLVEYSLAQDGQNAQPGRSQMTVLFTLGARGLLWSGVWFEELSGEGVLVRYPAGEQESAQVVLEQAQAILQAADGRLGLRVPEQVVIKLYGSELDFRQSIMLAFPAGHSLPGWTAAGASLKLLDWAEVEAETLHPTLTLLLMRQVLQDSGVTAEWLLKGLSAYLAGEIDGGATGRRLAQRMEDLLSSAQSGELAGLDELLQDPEMPADQRELAYAHAWDTVRYLVDTYGENAVRGLVARQAAGLTLVQAFEASIRTSLSSFESEWAQSLALGHARPEWVEVAMRFDALQAQDHITFLASRVFTGRQAGTTGAEEAAEYIAEHFAAYGLLPIGDIIPADIQEIEGESSPQRSYLQRFPINFTMLLRNPELATFSEQDQSAEIFIFRQDFVLVPEVIGSGGEAQGELIWVRDGTYEGMNLEGAIAVRRPYNPLVEEITRAQEHGASGLILVGSMSEEQGLAKAAILQEPLVEASIPVLELTSEGFERLLQAAGQTQHNLDTSPPALSLEMQVQMQVLLSQPRLVDSANVLGLLRGSDPDLADEVIIIGAHYDHVGDDPGVEYCQEVLPAAGDLPEEVLCGLPSGRRYPGANDNASGVAVMLEIARLWQDKGYQPRRSVVFAAWGAQEMGQVGSDFYVQHPAYPLESTVAVVQLDAVGGGSGYYLEANFDWQREAELLYIITRAEEAVDGRLAKVTTTGIGDHLPFREAGVPTLPLAWRGANEDNMPEGFDDEIEVYRLSVTGRMVSLVLMSLAR